MIKFREHLDLLSQSEILGLKLLEVFYITPFELNIIKDAKFYTVYDLVNCDILELRDRLKESDKKGIYYSSLYVLIVDRIHKLGFEFNGEEEFIEKLKTDFNEGKIDLSNIVRGSRVLKNALKGKSVDEVSSLILSGKDNFVGLNSDYNQYYVLRITGMDIKGLISEKVKLLNI